MDNSYQSAYKSGHSTETALLSIKNDIHLSPSRGEATVLVLLDLSDAFDTIDHSTLLDCLLDWFGVSGLALKWFSYYLTERYQCVKIGSTLSKLQKLVFGVPQGSVLGPLLFSLYTSPLSTLIGRHEGVNFQFSCYMVLAFARRDLFLYCHNGPVLIFSFLHSLLVCICFYCHFIKYLVV